MQAKLTQDEQEAAWERVRGRGGRFVPSIEIARQERREAAREELERLRLERERAAAADRQAAMDEEAERRADATRPELKPGTVFRRQF